MHDLMIKFVSPYYKKEVIDLYKKHHKIAKTEYGAFDWRIKRQFSSYFTTPRSIIGAWDYGKLIGFIAWQQKPILDPYLLIPTPSKNGRREIITWSEQLVVLENCRRQGIGNRLFTEFLNEVKGNGTRLRNTCQQEWLVKFHESFGYKCVFKGFMPKNPSLIYWINEKVGNNGNK